MSAYQPKSVQEAWDNHFSAFGGKDMDKILKDYDENSVITVFNYTTENKEVFKGVEGAKKLFTGLWKAIPDYKTLKAPVCDVDEKARMVFLCWECKGCGHEAVTDTFIFTEDFKILRQNIMAVTTKSCCPPNRSSLMPPNDYTPVGKEAKIGDLDCYIVGEAKNGAVVVLHDVFGWKSGRHKGVCDELASKGYYVIMPDLYRGGKAEFKDLGTPRLVEFLKSWATEKWQPDMDKVYAHLVEKKIPASKTGMVGFCWGTWAIWNESSRCGEKFSAASCFHPSIPIEQLFGRSIEALAEKVKNPLLMAPCKGDHASLQKDGASHEVFKKKSLEVDYIPFPNMEHGFVSQGDLSKKEIYDSVTTAMDETFKLFEKYLK